MYYSFIHRLKKMIQISQKPAKITKNNSHKIKNNIKIIINIKKKNKILGINRNPNLIITLIKFIKIMRKIVKIMKNI